MTVLKFDERSLFEANIGSMKFSSEPRRTMECMYVRGAAGPGTGKQLGFASNMAHCT